MERAYEEAFAEVDEILKIMPIELLSKIPAQFREVISKNKAKNYNIEIQEPIEENLKEETVVILGLIYRDFLASPEEKEELQLKDAEEYKKIEEELKKQYDIQNAFEKRRNDTGLQTHNTTELTVYKEQGFLLTVYKEQGFLRKLFNIIKRIFNKNKF